MLDGRSFKSYGYGEKQNTTNEIRPTTNSYGFALYELDISQRSPSDIFGGVVLPSSCLDVLLDLALDYEDAVCIGFQSLVQQAYSTYSYFRRTCLIQEAWIKVAQ